METRGGGDGAPERERTEERAPRSLSRALPPTYQPGLGGGGHGPVGFEEPAVVGQEQPQSHVKCEDQGSPQTRSKQRSGQDPPKPVVLSSPGREEGRMRLGLLASDPPSP